MTDETTLYLVRIWAGPSAGSGADDAAHHGFRASVRHVESEDVVLFTRIDALAHYLARPLRLPGDTVAHTRKPTELHSGESHGTS